MSFVCLFVVGYLTGNNVGMVGMIINTAYDMVINTACSTQEEVLVSTEIEFDISLVLKKSYLRKLATSPRKLLYYLAVIRSGIDADKARPVDKQLVTDLRKTSF